MQSRISQVSGWAALSEFEHFHNLGGLGLKATKSPDEKLSKWKKKVSLDLKMNNLESAIAESAALFGEMTIIA